MSLGAPSGRTTLGGEGLQHQDGSSHLVAATIPNCKAYDPAFAGEMAVVVDTGMREMLVEQKDVFYYVALMGSGATLTEVVKAAHLLSQSHPMPYSAPMLLNTLLRSP